MGRPKGTSEIYTDELADEICRRIAAGESVNKICKTEGMPCGSTVRTWAIEDYKGFYAKYARAREVQAEFLAEKINEIADDDIGDFFADVDGKKPNRVNVERAKLRVDALKWHLSKVLPKKFGEHKAVTLGGEMTVNNTQLTPRQAADALLSAAAEDDDGFDSDGGAL